MNLCKLIIAYINMMVPTPSEEWDVRDAGTLDIGIDDNHYLITHVSGRWFEKVIDKKERPIYICNSEHHRYLIRWREGKPLVKYKAPNGWKWVKLN